MCIACRLEITSNLIEKIVTDNTGIIIAIKHIRMNMKLARSFVQLCIFDKEWKNTCDQMVEGEWNLIVVSGVKVYEKTSATLEEYLDDIEGERKVLISMSGQLAYDQITSCFEEVELSNGFVTSYL